MTWYFAQIEGEETKMQSPIVHDFLPSPLVGIQLAEQFILLGRMWGKGRNLRRDVCLPDSGERGFIIAMIWGKGGNGKESFL